MAQSEVALGTFTIGAPPPVRAGQRTYHLGNSLTDTINGWLAPVAQSAGYRHDYLRSTIPGAPTDWNWDHPGNANGEPDYRVVFAAKAPIDHLFTQPFAGHDRSIENEAEYSGRFFRLAREKESQRPALALRPVAGPRSSATTGRREGERVGPGSDPRDHLGAGGAKPSGLCRSRPAAHGRAERGQGHSRRPGGSALARLKQEIEAGAFQG
jgi:hypothetical protein